MNWFGVSRSQVRVRVRGIRRGSELSESLLVLHDSRRNRTKATAAMTTVQLCVVVFVERLPVIDVYEGDVSMRVITSMSSMQAT